MSRHIKRLLMLFGFVVLVACMWIGWYLLRIHAATQHIAWQAQEGGLTLSYFPLKDQAIIFVGSDYAQGGTLTWTMTDPGATNWIIAPPPLSAPEELLGRAWIGKLHASLQAEPQPHPKYGLRSSSARGLVSLYADASEVQRLSIVYQFEQACEKNHSFCDALQKVQALAGRSSTIQYIDDPSRFKGESDATLTPEEAKAIMIAKRHLERQFGKQLRASFTVSSAEWGYQVDFTDVQCITDAGDRWERVSEGFGEVLLSEGFDVIKASIGP